jgi:hypothetical protein
MTEFRAILAKLGKIKARLRSELDDAVDQAYELSLREKGSTHAQALLRRLSKAEQALRGLENIEAMLERCLAAWKRLPRRRSKESV